MKLTPSSLLSARSLGHARAWRRVVGATLFVASGLAAMAAVRNVNSDSTLASALSAANPGDTIVLANGTYAGFAMSRSGTSTSPIVIQAATRGAATIASGGVALNGVSYVTVKGLTLTTSGGSGSYNGTTQHYGVVLNNAHNCRVSQCTFRLSAPVASTYWVLVGGSSSSNRVDYNEFGPYTGTNRQIYVFPTGNPTISGVTPPSDRSSWANGGSPNNPNIARSTQIDHNYFHDKASGTSEVLILGGIGVTGDYQNTSTVVDTNLFVNCDGDAEIISSKSSNNTIKNNTIRTSVGMISLRAGNNGTITGNLLLQGSKSGTGGIKIYEHNHTVTGNYVENTGDYAYLIGAGDAYSSSSFAHAACVNCDMDNNFGVGLNVRAAIIGHGGSGVAPSGCSFSGNALRGTVSPLIALSNAGDTVISGNSTSGTNPAMPHAALTTSNVGPAATPYTSPSSGPTFAGYYKIIARHSGKAAVVEGASTVNSANVIQYTYNASRNDEWQFNDLGGGTYAVINRLSTLAMVVQSASTAENANVIQYSFGGSNTNDEWQVIDSGGGYYRLVNGNSGKALTVAGASTTNGAAFQQATWTGATNQQFQIISVP
jgi:hypothetical protein